MVGIKPAFNVSALASRRLKLDKVDDVLVITAMTVFKRKSIAEIIAVLLMLCCVVPDMTILEETLEASFEARPARRPSLVLSGLDVQPERAEADSVQREGAVGGGPAAAGETPDAEAGAARPAIDETEGASAGEPESS
eukprot:contig_25871_g6374